MAADFIQLVQAVVARCYHNFGSRGSDLVGFDFAGCDALLGELAHREHAPAAATAEVLRAVRGHFNEVLHHVAQDIARLIDDAALAGLVARVVIGDALAIHRGVQLEPAFLDVLRLQLHKADHREGIAVTDPVLALPALRAVAMPALGHHQGLGAQVVDGFLQVGGDGFGRRIVAGEQPIVGSIPAGAAQSPVFPGRVVDLGRRLDQVGEVLDLPWIEGVDHPGVLLVDRNLDRWVIQLGLQLFFHPLQRLDVIFLADAHVVAALQVHVDRGLQAFGGHIDSGQHGACRADDVARIHAHRAVDHAAPAHGARAEGGLDQLIDHLLIEGRRARPSRRNLAQRVVDRTVQLAQLLGPVGRHILRLGIRHVVVAGFGAQPAAHAHL